MRQELVVGGWLPRQGTAGRDARRSPRRLSRGGRRWAPLRYAGRVGSGFTDERAGPAVRRARAVANPREPLRGPTAAEGGASSSSPGWWPRSTSGSGPPRARFAPPSTRACGPTRTPREVVLERVQPPPADVVQRECRSREGLGQSGLRRSRDDRARRAAPRTRPVKGELVSCCPGDPPALPREHPRRAAARRARPQPARHRRRLLAGAAGRRDHRRRHHPGRRGPARDGARRARGRARLRRRRQAAPGGVDRAARQHPRDPGDGDPRRRGRGQLPEPVRDIASQPDVWQTR